MTLPDDLLARSADEAVRRVALQLLDEAEAARDRLVRGEDGEALHDFRVALRRLRSHARAHARHLDDALDRGVRKKLAKIQRATGGARDAEVGREWLERLVAELGERVDRPEAAPLARAVAPVIVKLEQTVESDDRALSRPLRRAIERFERLVERHRGPMGTTTVQLRGDEPESYGAVVGGLARTHVAALAERLEAVGGPEEVEAIHDARIAGKRLRYLLEPARERAAGATELVKTLKRLQDLLGDLNDLAVLDVELTRRGDELAGGEGEAVAEREAHDALQALRAHLSARRGEIFADVASSFAGLGLAELVDRVETLARRLDGVRQTETERKYLLRTLPPEARRHPCKELSQGYLPGEKLQERVRREERGREVRYLRTLKAGRGVQRIEVEEATTAEVFDVLWTLTEGRRVIKRRYRVEEGGLVWEIDEFLDRALVLAEVELPASDVQPPIPSWLRPHLEREVTGEDAYVNLNLAK
ncbi:MAG: CHAD domain-containing protein [Myxococcales bacterium]|nr:CHAD domain-containing protein [Myxococcales bacterium]